MNQLIKSQEYFYTLLLTSVNGDFRYSTKKDLPWKTTLTGDDGILMDNTLMIVDYMIYVFF